MSDEGSIPRQTPKGVDKPDHSSNSEPESKEDDAEKTSGSGYQMTRGPGTTPGGHSPEPESIRKSAFNDEEAALDSLREVKEIDDPVERLKEYAYGKATEALLGLLEPPEAAITEIQDAQKQAFQEIRTRAEERTLLEGIRYLEDVLFEFDLADDMRVNGTGLIGKVERKVEKLKGHLERKRERQTGDRPTSRGRQPNGEPESSSERWRHLARAVKVLERHPELSSFGEFREEVLGMSEELGLGGYNSPGEAVKKGVLRLRRDLTDEDGTPPRYHEMEGFKTLVHDLARGEDVALKGHDPSKTARQ